MSNNNLSIDGEFRYIIQWFHEWSEMQRDDFVPVMVEYLLQGNSDEVHMDGLVNSISHAAIQNKPMSLFQCRVKLFREWNTKWPLEFKHKLQEKIMEIDSKVAEKISTELKTHGGEHVNNITNGYNGNGSDIETSSIESELERGNENIKPIAENVFAEAAQEQSSDLDRQIVAALHNETPVDDNTAAVTSDNAEHNNTIIHTHTTNELTDATATAATIQVNSFIDTQLRLEPAEQVEMQTQNVLGDNNMEDDCNVTNSATVA